MSKFDHITRITPRVLDAVIDRAHRERWSELTLVGAAERWHLEELANSEGLAKNVFLLSDAADGFVTKLHPLTNLIALTLPGNSIGDHEARAFAALTSLTFLDLQNNEIGDEGASALAALTSLTSLNLRNNRIGGEGARALASLTSLASLDLRNNRIGDEGASALASLTSLTSLDLQNNEIGDEGASALASLAGLTSLNLQNNRMEDEGVRSLLNAWAYRPSMDSLVLLDLRGNSNLGSVLPPEVTDTSDARAILAAYRRFRTATLKPLNEAKLLVVGNEAVGKTSLIRYLVRNESRTPDEPMTRGAAIYEKIDTLAWLPEESEIRLKIWDFGGQEVMRGTHRYFLTERSLYLLVLEDRREDDVSIYEWLRTIQSRGGNSPIIVVINKSDEGKQDLRLDETGLRREFPAIVDILRTSCNPGDWAAHSIAALRRTIAVTLGSDERLEHVRDPIPASWLRVKDSIEAISANEYVLPMVDFQRRCAEPAAPNGDPRDAITDPDEQRALLRLLNDLGVVIAHGLEREAPAVKREITLLNPNWLTEAIYKLLMEPEIRDLGGEFNAARLNDWLDPTLYPPERHEFILTMMQDPEVGLCLRLPGIEDRYLLPEALPASEPYFKNWPEDSLRFRFRYEFLPRRLIPSLIVEAHANLAQPPTRWRTGMVLEAAQCPILVRGDLERRQIDIKVDGPERLKRAALNIVLNYFEDVHARNREIGAQSRVPLPEQPELDVSYDHLLTLESSYGPGYEYPVEGANRAYPVRELLDGVRHEQIRNRDQRDERRGDQTQRSGITVGDDAPNGGAENTSTNTLRSGWLTVISSWRFFSIACGAGAVLFAVTIMLLPSNEYRMLVGWPVALGVLVTVLMLKRNPAFFYRRMLSYAIAGGIVLAAAGFSIDIFAAGEPGTGWFRLSGAASSSFFIAWAVIVVILVWADLKQTLNSR